MGVLLSSRKFRSGLPIDRLGRFANEALPWEILGALLRRSAWGEDPSAIDEWNDMNSEALAERLAGTTMAAFLPMATEKTLQKVSWSSEELSIATAATIVWWEQCTHGGELIDFYSLTDDREGLVRATVACVRAVLQQESLSDARTDAALDAAERWCDGKEDIEQVGTLADRVWNEVAAGDMPSLGAAVYNAVITMEDRNAAYGALESLADLLTDRVDRDEAFAMLATMVRSLVECPEFEAPSMESCESSEE